MNTGRQWRADQLLRQLFSQYNRHQLQSMIKQQKISFVDAQGQWHLINKPSQIFSADYLDSCKFRIEESEWNQYVSRAGIKLAGALQHFAVDVTSLWCLDVGLSTGGFSDCLLQSGAQAILGIDVGRGQLHPRLRNSVSLFAVDKVNAREPIPAQVLQQFFGDRKQEFHLIVVDVSFISLAKIIPNLCQYLVPGGHLLTLVKPQFELGPEALNRRGVVKVNVDPGLAVEKILQVFTGNNMEILGHCPSVIAGDDGNKEFFIYGKKLVF